MHTTRRRTGAALATLVLALTGVLAGWIGPGPTPAGAQAGPPAGTRWAHIDAGTWTTCGITDGGDAYCWGSDFGEALGNGSAAGTPWPNPVATPDGVRWAQISAADSTVCAVSTVGAGYCWGLNSRGQMGVGNADTLENPAPVPVATPAGETWAQIEVGAGTVCGVTTDGDAYCWGDSSRAQIGDGGSDGLRLSPTPVDTPTGVTWSAISVGLDVTCGLSSAGTAYCWGEDSVTGDGVAALGISFDARPVAVAVPAGVTFAQVSAGWRSSCGVTTTGDAYCWGATFHGQPPDSPQTRYGPVPLSKPAGVDWAEVGVGDAFACGRTVDDAVHCWGRGEHGVRGDDVIGGPPTRTPAPVTMPTGVAGFSSISVGRGYTCALAEPGGIGHCWGEGGLGQLAPPTSAESVDRPTPTPITRIPQTVTFPALPDQVFGDPAVPLAATASSGDPVAYTTSGPCTIVDGPKVAATGAGACAVVASQSGPVWAPASSTRTFAIGTATSQTSLGADPLVAGLGDPIALTATVTGAGFPTGTVAFTATPGSGQPVTASSGVSPEGRATWTPTNLPAGTYSVVAVYGGGQSWTGSTSTAVTIKVLTAAEEAVAAAYGSVLGRTPDAGGLQYWAGQLGTKTPAQVADAIAKSREGRTRLVTLAYQSVFQRTPSTTERDYWVTELLAGRTTPEALTATLYADVRTAPVDALYRIHLGWTPTATDRTYWGPKVDTPAERRSTSLSVGRGTDGLRTLIRRATTAACGAGHAVPTGAALTATQGFARDTAHDLVRVTARLAATHCPTT